MDDPVRTFSVGFKEHEQYNELAVRPPDRRALRHRPPRGADRLGRPRVDFLPELIHHQDEPIADWVCVPLYYVAKLARDNGTIVVQVGEGSDELFHGYDLYIDEARFGGGASGSRSSASRGRCGRRGRAHRPGSSRRTGRGVIHAQAFAEAAVGPAAVLGRRDLLPGRPQERR